MTEKRSPLKSAEDLVRAVLEKNFGQKVDAESVRTAAEKIVGSLPAADESKRAA